MKHVIDQMHGTKYPMDLLQVLSISHIERGTGYEIKARAFHKGDVEYIHLAEYDSHNTACYVLKVYEAWSKDNNVAYPFPFYLYPNI